MKKIPQFFLEVYSPTLISRGSPVLNEDTASVLLLLFDYATLLPMGFSRFLYITYFSIMT